MLVPTFICIVPCIQVMIGIAIVFQIFSDKSCIKPHCYRLFVFLLKDSASSKVTVSFQMTKN
jgi:hypothetical protein